MGPSSAGAMGPWQFEPYTWPSYSSAPFSEATSWSVSTPAYVSFMKQLLQEEGGNVRNALAAYNAGPDNISAGYGYADEILSLAGQSQTVSVTSSSSTSAAGINIPGVSSITGLISSVTEIANVFKDIDTVIMDILNPAFWLRIASFFAGVFLLAAGIWCLVHASDNSPLIPQNLPTVVPV